MESQVIILKLEKIGITILDDSLSLDKSKTIPFSAISLITIDTPQFSFFRKAIFWVNRILLRGDYYFYHQVIPFYKSLDYRFLYELKVLLKNGEVLSKYIKDFDLFAVSKALRLLNKEISNT